MNRAKIRFQCNTCRKIAEDYNSATNCCPPTIVYENIKTKRYKLNLDEALAEYKDSNQSDYIQLRKYLNSLNTRTIPFSVSDLF